MKMVIKNKQKQVEAYQLGMNYAKEIALIKSGKIKDCGDGTYELFSQEAHGFNGEKAKRGDYFKIDHAGYPYPIEKSHFEESHVHIADHLFTQKTRPLLAWTASDPICPEIEYLIHKKGLVINEGDESKYYEAPLWGTILTADKDAVIIFYSIKRDDVGSIEDVDFNFVAKDEFEKTYSYVDEG